MATVVVCTSGPTRTDLGPMTPGEMLEAGESAGCTELLALLSEVDYFISLFTTVEAFI